MNLLTLIALSLSLVAPPLVAAPLLAPNSLPAPSSLPAPPTGKPKPGFEITGTAVSSRDGAPIPFCRLRVTEARAGAEDPRPDDRATDQNGPPQQGFGRGRGQRPGQGPAASDDSIVADAHGHFVVDLPHAGSWRLVGSARGFQTQAYNHHDGFTSSVVLSEQTPTYDLTLELDADAVISGTILDDAGEGVRTAQVTAERVLAPLADHTPAAPRQAGFATTDDRGHYELTRLAPGAYRVRVQAQPWYASTRAAGANAALDPSLDFVYAPTWFPGALDQRTAEIIALAGGEQRQADFQLQPLPAVHLQMPKADTDQQRRPINPQIVPVDSDLGISRDQFDPNSASLAPGTYQVTVPGPDGRPSEDVRELTVPAGSSGTLSLDQARPLTRLTYTIDGVAPSEIQQVIFIDTDTGRRITSVAVHRELRRDTEPADDDQPGRVQSISLAPRRYDVFLSSRRGAYLTGISATGARVNGRAIEISEGAPKLVIHAASELSEITGRVLDTGGKPTVGAMVVLVPASLGAAGDLHFISRDESNSDGSFSIRAVPGKYILIAIDRGWQVNWRDTATLARYLVQGTPLEVRAQSHLHPEITAQRP